MVLAKRYCVEYVDGTIECFRDGGFWYTEVRLFALNNSSHANRRQKGMIIKWAILGSLFAFFILWFVGGYIHARRRLKAGKPLLAYHRVRPPSPPFQTASSRKTCKLTHHQFLVSWQEQKRYGQTPQNHFTFYNTQNPYQNRPPYAQRQDGSWPEPPPMYNAGDAPPTYGAPPGATKASPNQSGNGQQMEMPTYGAPQGPQQNGVVGGNGDVEQGQALPPRPPQKAKAVLKGFTERFRK